MEKSFHMLPVARPEISVLKKDFREYELAGQDIPWIIAKFLTPGDFFDTQIFAIGRTGLIVVSFCYTLKVFCVSTKYVLITYM